MHPDSERRRFLATAGAGIAVAVGGCLGRSDGATPSQTSGDAATDTETQTQTNTATETPEPTMSTVFHFSGEPSVQNHAVANVSNLLDDDSTELGNVALVANGAGIKLLVEGDSTVADRIRSLVDEGVAFYACHNSMDAFGITEDDLLHPAIEVVPAGVGALTKLQVKEGYAYIETP